MGDYDKKIEGQCGTCNSASGFTSANCPSGPEDAVECTSLAHAAMLDEQCNPKDKDDCLYNQYQKELGMRGIAPEIVRTKISFDTSASFPKLQFGFGGFISEDVQTAIEPLFGSDKVLEITGENKAAAPVTPAPEEAPPVEVVEEVAKTPAAETAPAEEVKTTGFGKATTSEKPASEEPAGEVKSTGFGKATSTDAAIPAEAPAETKEPEAAATAPVDATTAGLADEITALMEEVADDA